MLRCVGSWCRRWRRHLGVLLRHVWSRGWRHAIWIVSVGFIIGRSQRSSGRRRGRTRRASSIHALVIGVIARSSAYSSRWRSHKTCIGPGSRRRATRLLSSRVQWFHLHVLRTRAAVVLHSSSSRIVPGGHLGQRIFVEFGFRRTSWRVESRDLSAPIRRRSRGRRRRLIDSRWHRRRRVMIRRRIIHVLLLGALLSRRRTTTGQTSATTRAALDPTTETIDNAGQNRNDNDCPDDDRNDDGPSTQLAHNLKTFIYRINHTCSKIWPCTCPNSTGSRERI